MYSTDDNMHCMALSSTKTTTNHAILHNRLYSVHVLFYYNNTSSLYEWFALAQFKENCYLWIQNLPFYLTDVGTTSSKHKIKYKIIEPIDTHYTYTNNAIHL